MADIRELRPDLIASRYGALATGPALLYSFENQEGIPIDGTNPSLREMSPFTLRIVPPTIVDSGSLTGANVNLIGQAGMSVQAAQSSADAVRAMYGISSVSGSGASSAQGTLSRIVSAGQVVSGILSTTQRAVLVDRFTAADIALQIENALLVPPLTLLVNPKEFNITYGVVQNSTARGRKGFIFERWGETQPTISISGMTGAFIAGANPLTGQGANTQSTSSPSGVQGITRRDSAAWQNFISLYQFYRHNGYIYDTIGKTEAHLMVGAIAIDFDQFTYVGHIESFDYAFSGEQPHKIEWSMQFTVDQMYDSATSPTSIAPYASPTPSPSSTSRSGSSSRADTQYLLGGGVQVSGVSGYAESPLSMLMPSQLLK